MVEKYGSRLKSNAKNRDYICSTDPCKRNLIINVAYGPRGILPSEYWSEPPYHSGFAALFGHTAQHEACWHHGICSWHQGSNLHPCRGSTVPWLLFKYRWFNWLLRSLWLKNFLLVLGTKNPLLPSVQLLINCYEGRLQSPWRYYRSCPTLALAHLSASPRNQGVPPVWPWFFTSAPSPLPPGPLLASRRPLEPKFLPQCFSVWLLPVYWSVNNLFNLICTAPKGDFFSNFSLDWERKF